MNTTEIAKGIYYVGCQDWTKKDFHGYTTQRGVTYNSYLIVDEKICLIDLVREPFADELLARVAAIVDPQKIDYIVMNHVENDHASSLPAVTAKLGRPEILISAAGAREAKKLYGDYNFRVVKEGDSLSLGKNTLKFIPFPMLHWPDSMASYLPEEEILFSNDAFGQHICTSSPFDDRNDLQDIMYEAEKYYANILMMYSKLIGPALAKAGALPMKLICPSHGVIWRSHIDKILAKYQDWGAGKKCEKVLVVYESMWGGTEKMARAVFEGVCKAGVEARLYKLSASDQSHIAADMLEAAGVIFGSSTLNYGMMPVMGALLTYFKGLKPVGKAAAVFGTYGWSGGAQKDMEELLQKTGMQVEPGLTVNWTPDAAEKAVCENFGHDFAVKACKNK